MFRDGWFNPINIFIQVRTSQAALVQLSVNKFISFRIKVNECDHQNTVAEIQVSDNNITDEMKLVFSL